VSVDHGGRRRAAAQDRPVVAGAVVRVAWSPKPLCRDRPGPAECQPRTASDLAWSRCLSSGLQVFKTLEFRGSRVDGAQGNVVALGVHGAASGAMKAPLLSLSDRKASFMAVHFATGAPRATPSTIGDGRFKRAKVERPTKPGPQRSLSATNSGPDASHVDAPHVDHSTHLVRRLVHVWHPEFEVCGRWR
jgi:hypothetical protein